MSKLIFNVAEAPKAEGFDPIPAGRYNVVIIDSDYVATKAGTGHYLKLTIKVLDGDYAGRLIWSNLNLDNPNEKAVEIAQRQLASICNACEITAFEDSAELHGIPMSGQVKIRPGSGGYDPQNTIDNFKAPVEDNGGEAAPWGS